MFEKGETAMKPNPVEGKGERDTECRFNDSCLDVAARKDWQAFNCEDCEIAYTGLEPGAEKDKGTEVDTVPEGETCLGCGKVANLQLGYCPDCLSRQVGASAQPVEKKPAPKPNVRICEECGERPTIQPNQPLCGRCIGARKKLKKTAGGDTPKTAPVSTRAAQVPQNGAGGQVDTGAGKAAETRPGETGKAQADPRPGRGLLDTSCGRFDHCQSLVSWIHFTCEHCDFFQGRISARYELPVYSAVSPSTGAAEASSGQGGQADIGLSPSAVVVDFAGHETILEDTRSRAADEIRDVQHQIIYMVKTALEG